MCEISSWVGGCSTGFDGCSVCGVSWELFRWGKIGVFGFVSYQSAGFRRKELLSLDTSLRIYYLHPHAISPTVALFPTPQNPLFFAQALPPTQLSSNPPPPHLYTQTQISPSPSYHPPATNRKPCQIKKFLLPLLAHNCSCSDVSERGNFSGLGFIPWCGVRHPASLAP